MSIQVSQVSELTLAALLQPLMAWSLGSGNRVMWGSSCDFQGLTYLEVIAFSTLCGDICANSAKFTHWAWTSKNGGTYFLKNGDTDKSSYLTGAGCGWIIRRFTEATAAPMTAPPLPVAFPNWYPGSGDKNGGVNTASQLSGAGCGFVVGRFFDPSVPVVTPKPTLPPPALAPVTEAPAPVNGPTSDETKEILNFINAFRLSNNLPPLKINNLPMRAATEHAKDQVNQCTLSHKKSNGSTPLLRATRNGYKTKMVWKNIAVGRQAMPGILDPWWAQ
uniref:SCP domain-containing protein n=1 Tax=Globisporangium ultimum (strain ATCC 200006 / CBS 805.95 / DAOM BR144) TaxID=431595 RepID=K3WZR9_GLOUD